MDKNLIPQNPNLDDTEGHMPYAKRDLVDDVEAHGKRPPGVAVEDVEGHMPRVRIAPAEDVEGHMPFRKDVVDDAEGHRVKRGAPVPAPVEDAEGHGIRPKI